jgi:predicted RNA-binding protein with PIN domain
MSSYLIDGYNLLHQTGALSGRTSSAGLQKARLGLLGMLRGAFGEDAGLVTVVFDAARASPGATEVQDYHGIQVRFAIHQDQADDLIEELIRKAAAPSQLTIVSDDHRVQKAARRRHCPVLGCGEFLDMLARRRKQGKQRGPDVASKPQRLSGEETEHWLKEFADLENDPDFKEAFDPFDFGEDESDK